MNDQNLPQNVTYLPAPPTSTLAIISLVTGILSYVGLPVLGAIAALITGYLARSETRAIPPRASGDGLATAGIILGWIHVALVVIGFCCFGAYILFSLGTYGIFSHGR
jgi:hypothetical protein